MQSAKLGFTLIELSITVAIIGILASIAIPQYQQYIVRAQFNRIYSEISNISRVVETCVNDGKLQIGEGANQCDLSINGSTLLQGNSQMNIVLPTELGVAQVTNPITINSHVMGVVSPLGTATLRGKKIVLIRDENGSWSCQSNVERRYLNNDCSYNAL